MNSCLYEVLNVDDIKTSNPHHPVHIIQKSHSSSILCRSEHATEFTEVHFQPCSHLQRLAHAVSSPCCQHAAHREQSLYKCLRSWGRYHVQRYQWDGGVANSLLPELCSDVDVPFNEMKGKEEYLYSAFYIPCISRSAQAWITQFYLQIHHACISFVSVHQMALPLTEVKDIQLQLTTHLSTRRDERLSWPG